MSPDIVKLIIQVLVIYGPSVAKAVTELFKKNDVSVADIEALLEKALQKSYDDYIGGVNA